MTVNERLDAIEQRLTILEQDKQVEQEVWLQYRFEGTQGGHPQTLHGIGRDATEAKKLLPKDFTVNVFAVLGEIEPESFELFWTSDHLKEAREKRLKNRKATSES